MMIVTVLLRSGLNEISAEKAAMIIRSFYESFCSQYYEYLMYFSSYWYGDDYYKPSFEILTDLSKEVIRLGDIKEAHSRRNWM